MMSTPPPSPGQLVSVRRRQFVVTEVRPSGLPVDPTVPITGSGPQHLVTLSSVEDDAAGEEVRVIWEIEPGVQIHERAALPEPTGFDDPVVLDTFLDAVRWGAVSSADVKALHAPFRSGITIEDYQLDPVVRALQMPRVNLLIADDVGLGKTIESGLVAQELILRHRVRTVLVVCPAALQIQWRDQMRDKFGLEFRIVDTDLMHDLRRTRGLHVNPWTHFPRLITSIDYLKRDRPLRLFRETLPPEGQPPFPRRYDLLIVDEAHNAAPSGSGRYAVDSLRTQAIRTIAPHFEHKVFVSATPHNGYQESFTALLELLDDQRFHRGVRPDRNQLAAVMVRRLKSELPPRWDGSDRFPRRQLEALQVEYTPEDRAAHRQLTEYVGLRRERASDETDRFASEFVLKLLKKRLFSSPAAFLGTLQQHLRSRTRPGRTAATPSRPRPAPGILRRQVDGIDEEYADDQAYEQATAEAVDSASAVIGPIAQDEEQLLTDLRRYAEATVGRPDRKAQRLIRWLDESLRPDGRWSDRRVIVFTEYRATQKWLHEQLAHAGFGAGDRILTLYGGMPTDERERIKAAFQASPEVSPVRILLATDAASEGIDLQNHCSRLIHYEIPWNPNRMEQRNGRVDRHGQRDKQVLVHHFVAQGYREEADAARDPGDLDGDLEFLMRAARKVETIREDLGKVGPVIAEQVEEAMLGRRRSLDTDAAQRDADHVRAMLRFERKLREQLEQLHAQLHESRVELRLAPENIQSVVEIGLRIAGQPPLREAEVPRLWPDPAGRRTRCPVFHVPALGGSWAPSTIGLAHPHTGERRPIVFDHDLAAGRDDVVLAHLNHRLVQMCLRLLRAEIWAPEGRRALHRVTARLVPSRALEAPVVVAHGRLVVLGGDNVRIHEEVITAAGELREGRFRRLNVGQTKAALDAALPDAIPTATHMRLADLWPAHRDALLRSLEVRMAERTGNLGTQLAERAEKEVRDLTSILRELDKAIEAELGRKPDVQLELFTPDQSAQFERDRESLRARRTEIPREIERETAALRARYANPTARLFPVAVTYLVPERIARADGG